MSTRCLDWQHHGFRSLLYSNAEDVCLDAEDNAGLFQIQQRVSGREGEACVKFGIAIKSILIAGRSSTFCPKCQK